MRSIPPAAGAGYGLTGGCMGTGYRAVSSSRTEFTDKISARELAELAADLRVQTLQASQPVKERTWRLINEKVLQPRPDIEIRVYGHYGGECDLSFLRNIPDVRHFSADCLLKATHVEALGNLPGLRSLGVGIFSLEDFSFLGDVPETLDHLYLGATRSKKPDLSILERFTSLSSLSLEAQGKNLSVVGSLASLEKLVLRSVSPPDLAFLRNLPRLWSLDIKLGGIRNLDGLRDLERIRYLELWQVRGLSDLAVISTLTGLQYLYLQSLRNVATLPDCSRLVHLRRVYLETMKGLQSISGVLRAPALEEFIHVCAQNMQPEQYAELLSLPTLRAAAFGFGSDRKNQRMDTMLAEHGIQKYTPAPFEFRVD